METAQITNHVARLINNASKNIGEGKEQAAINGLLAIRDFLIKTYQPTTAESPPPEKP